MDAPTGKPIVDQLRKMQEQANAKHASYAAAVQQGYAQRAASVAREADKPFTPRD